ncbi:MAG: hypothetical protein Q8L20_10660 [Gammaproteobacteria bacterium]|nr:hypothetical protein [Gammaproteobacteria bacterium]
MLDESGELAVCPYTKEMWRLANPNVSPPEGMPAEWMEREGIVEVIEVLPPVVDARLQVSTWEAAFEAGEWRQSWAVSDRSITEAKGFLKDALAEKYDQVSQRGFVYAGIRIGTDARSLALLIGAKVGGKNSRRVVTRHARVVLSKNEFDQMVVAADNFLQACQDNYFLIQQSIDDCTTITQLASVDIDYGWPAT